MDETKQNLILYVNAATDLAETLRRAIQRGGTIDDKTILALNNFVIAANNIKDVTDEIKKDEIKLN